MKTFISSTQAIRIIKFETAKDFWDSILVPDYNDFINNEGDLRKAFHAAISLFHMSDWVFHTHETSSKTFKYIDKNQITQDVKTDKDFANSLEQECSCFGLVRGIAHAGKHLKLTNVRPITSAPSHQANVQIQTTEGNSGTKSIIIFEGSNNLEILPIYKCVYEMWTDLNAQHSWW